VGIAGTISRNRSHTDATCSSYGRREGQGHADTSANPDPDTCARDTVAQRDCVADASYEYAYFYTSADHARGCYSDGDYADVNGGFTRLFKYAGCRAHCIADPVARGHPHADD
jgi:hypothetical protein